MKVNRAFIGFLAIFLFNVTVMAQPGNQAFKMSGINPETIEIDQIITQTTEITPFTNNMNRVYSMAISAETNLLDQNSLVRVILVDNLLEEHLVYESYPLLSPQMAEVTQEICEETCILDGLEPQSLRIEVTGASFDISSIIVATNIPPGLNIAAEARNKHQERNKVKIRKINNSLKANGKNWVAGQTSVAEMSYAERKKLYGQSAFPPGFEYYVGGVIQAGNNTKTAAAASPYISNWDWRERHGQDWISPVTNQSSCGSCWAFAATGATEAMTNVYFNMPGLNLNLSEQDVLSCSGAGDCGGGYPSTALSYISQTGVVNEGCFPYTATDQACANKCTNPSERIRIDGRINLGAGDYPKTEDGLKKMIIEKGPISGGLYDWSHAMTLVGYHTVEVGDYLYFRNNDTSRSWFEVPEGHALVGKTVWIFKNSWGSWFGDGGYVYVETGMSNFGWTHAITTPVYSDVVSRTVQCTDNDGDGYYWWGLGAKPSDCPVCSDLPDGDDSDPTKGPLDEYGYCMNIGGPPTANFTADNTSINAGANVQFTDQSNGATSWSWSFPGGTPATSAEQNPTITYNSTGNFDVILTASNSMGDDVLTRTSYINVTIPPPVADFSADNTTIFIGEEITFTDNSQNCTNLREWTFEGGSEDLSNPLKPVVVYNTEGTFDVTLKVYNAQGASDTENKTNYITVLDPNNLPYCDSWGDAGYEFIAKVEFSDLSNPTGASPNGYADYSDTKTANLDPGQSYTITLTPDWAGRSKFAYWGVWIDYNKDGDFLDAGEKIFTGGKSKSTVSGAVSIANKEVETTMRVSMARSSIASPCGDIGLGEVEDYKIIIGSPGPQPPVADFSYSVNCFTVYFDDMSSDSDGNITNRLWDFGDMGTSTGINPEHTYNQDGTYSVTLTVRDNDDQFHSVSKDVVIASNQRFYRDVDGDGYGVTDDYMEGCGPDQGFVELDGDCNDDNPTINPGAEEICDDNIDNNCDGNVDEGCNVPEYCEPVTISSSEFISAVSFGDINNQTLGSGYSLDPDTYDFSTGTYTINLAPSSTRARNFWRIWIDANNNGIFENDPNELIFSRDAQKGPFTADVGIDCTCDGLTRMRISMRSNKAPEPCDDGFKGEVEDYTLDFSAGKSGQLLNQDKLSEKSINIYPNPTADILFIDFKKWDGKKTIKLIELTGKTLFERDATGTRTEIDLSSYPKGIYFLEVNDGTYRLYKKISKQ